jgi:hypothetical protein
MRQLFSREENISCFIIKDTYMIVNISKTGIRKYRILSVDAPVFEEHVTGINLAYKLYEDIKK